MNWALAAPIDGLFPAGAVVELAVPSLETRALHPLERAVVESAVAKRRSEFYGGRVAAHRALARLGIHGHVLLPGADRAPIWPPGACGSISHAAGLCVAAVAAAPPFASLGIDVEPREDLPASLWDTVCTAREQAWLALRRDGSRGVLARLVFSAKEAAYKCQFPLTGELLDFGDCEIELDPAARRFEASFPARLPAACRRIAGRFAEHGSWLVTAASITRS